MSLSTRRFRGDGMTAEQRTEQTDNSNDDAYEISTDPARLDRALIHAFLSRESYWAKRIPFEVVTRSIDHSLNFGAYCDGTQVGYARVITDRATFAFIRDVFVVTEHRGRGLGRRLTESILAHPDMQRLRRIMLATRDAHGLYERAGFQPLARPELFMVIEASAKELYGR